MAVYSYIGLDAAGNEQQGQIEAESQKEVARILRERSVFLLKVQEGEGINLKGNPILRVFRLFSMLNPSRFAPVGSGDLVVLFRQLALMLRAGFTLVTALEACYELQAKHVMRSVVRKLARNIRRGESFSASMAREKKLFSPMIVNLVASGEQSGNLDSILERMAENMEQTKELKRQLMAAMFYPSFVLTVSLGVVVVLVVYVIPRFAAFLSARNAVLPASTQYLLLVSDWALYWGGPLAVLVGAGVFSTLAAYTTPPGKRVVDRFILGLPLVGKAVSLAAMAQAGWSLSMLLRSGLTALESLRITSSVINNRAISISFKKAAEGLLDGRSLSKTFDQPHIPLMMRHMAAVGENSGELDTVMHDVGEYYQKELVAKVKFLTVMIEPVLIMTAGTLVGYVYFALFQAVMSVSKGGI